MAVTTFQPTNLNREVTRNNDYKLNNANVDQRGGNNDTVTVNQSSTTNIQADNNDPTMVDFNRIDNAEITANVDAPQSAQQRQDYLNASRANQRTLAEQWLSKSGFDPSQANFSRSEDGNTLNVQARQDIDSNNTIDTANYSSTLSQENAGNGRRNYTITAEGETTLNNTRANRADLEELIPTSTTPADLAMLDNTNPNFDPESIGSNNSTSTSNSTAGELNGPDLNSDGTELNQTQQDNYADNGRYTQVDGNGRLEEGVQSDRLPDIRNHSRDNIASITGIDREELEDFGGPQDKFFGEQTANLVGTEESLRNLHNQGVQFNGDDVNSAINDEDFNVEDFNKNIGDYVSDWGDQLQPGDEVTLSNGQTYTIPENATTSSSSSESTSADVTSATSEAIENFDDLANEDGFITRDQLAKLDGGQELADNLDELIFAHPTDAGVQAWNGLSKNDLEAIQTRLDDGESISDIAKGARMGNLAHGELGLNTTASQAEFRQAVQQRRNTDAVDNAVENFSDLANRRGFVSKNDLQNIPGGEDLAKYFDALIFANATDGDTRAAWNGLSQQDLENIQGRLADGDSLSDIVQQAMENSSIGRNLDEGFSFEDFQAEVQQQRERHNPSRPRQIYFA